ncbi:MAG TPA: glycosyltransferase family 2 protein [Solirubrobacteraceae bacterium]|nr:glycosyltransferase family 2 protein [Solirubrobacteraceae bacterium]
MPFAGDERRAVLALATLRALRLGADDELILADNGGGPPDAAGVRIVRVDGERSPARARNAGARHASGEWILFLDADVIAPPDLLERFLSQPIADDVGALSGAVEAAPGRSLAERYGAARNFLGQEAHLAHPFLPRAAAANLLVRRAAFEQLGGFLEGLRAAEDTDFSWRLQRAGWRLEGRPQARVAHRYRASIGELRRQWRGYAAGRAWLARRYHGFTPQPALLRALRRLRAPAEARRAGPGSAGPQGAGVRHRRWPGRLLLVAIDTVLAVDELIGLALSNRPARPATRPASVVLVCDEFPAAGDGPALEAALSGGRRTEGAASGRTEGAADGRVHRQGALGGARVEGVLERVRVEGVLERVRVEAARRPIVVDRQLAERLRIDYGEDDGAAERVAALLRLAARHPLRCARERLSGGPGLAALAPAAMRLAREPSAVVRPLGDRATAQRLARLGGRAMEG